MSSKWFPYPKGYSAGARLEYVSTKVIKVKSCAARDIADEVNLILSSDTNVDLASSGDTGLDTGSFAGNTWYFFYLIGGPNKTTSVIASIDDSVPSYPAGYTHRRKICCLKSLVSDFKEFVDDGFWIYYQTTLSAQNVLSGGTATTITSVGVVNHVPVDSYSAILTIAFAPDNQRDWFRINASGDSAHELWGQRAVAVPTYAQTTMSLMAGIDNNGSSRYIYYLISKFGASPSLGIYVAAYSLNRSSL